MIYDALVIGAGPAGATAGLMLARAGWSVALVEKSSFPRRKVCGEFISATSLPLLRDLGVADSFLAQAGPAVREVGLFARETVLTADMPTARGFGRALGREHLDSLLLDAATRAGATLFQPWTVARLQRDGERFVSTMSAKDTVKELAARIVVAANGSWERSPLPFAQEKPHRPSDLLAFKAHFRESALPAGVMPLLVFPGGYGGMVHTDGGRVSLSCCIRRDQLRRRRDNGNGGRAADAVFQHILESCTGAHRALKEARLDGAWLSAGPIRPGIRPRYARGIFFAGNSAGEAHPIVAEGISIAMQSAWLLCRQLIDKEARAATQSALADIGRAYAKEWETCFATRIRAAAAFAHLAMRPHATAAALPLIQRFPRMLTWGARLSGKTMQVVPAV